MQLNNIKGLSSGDVEIDLENCLFHQPIPEGQPHVHPPRDPGAGAARLRCSANRASRLVRDNPGFGGPARAGEDPVYIAPRRLGSRTSSPADHYYIPGEAVLGAMSRYTRIAAVRPPHSTPPRLRCGSVPLGAMAARVEGKPTTRAFRNEFGRGGHVRSSSRRATL